MPVPRALQKLLYQAKKLIRKSVKDAQSTTLEKAGLGDGMGVQHLGSGLKESEGLKEPEALKELEGLKESETLKESEALKEPEALKELEGEGEDLWRERTIRERALKAPVKLRSTGSRIMTLSSPSIRYRFQNIRAPSHLPGVLSFLKKLASDPAIVHVMQKHRFSVGALTELAPHEHPELDGLNLGHGMEISLRVRTHDGFKPYNTVRRALCHELAHNTCDGHDENFQKMDSQLSREVAEYERSVAQRSHPLDSGEMYQPSSSELAEPKLHVGGSGAPAVDAESLEDRRRKILEAAMNRLGNEKRRKRLNIHVERAK